MFIQSHNVASFLDSYDSFINDKVNYEKTEMLTHRTLSWSAVSTWQHLIISTNL